MFPFQMSTTRESSGKFLDGFDENDSLNLIQIQYDDYIVTFGITRFCGENPPYWWTFTITAIRLNHKSRQGLLTHWGRVTHMCVRELTIIGSDNGLSPGRRQAIIWNNTGLLLIEPLGTNFREISIGIQAFSFKKMHLNLSSAKWRPFCLGLNVLKPVKIRYEKDPIVVMP